MTTAPSFPPSPLRARIHGVYGITAEQPDTARLLQDVAAALEAGIRTMQYRQKHAPATQRREQLQALKALCAQHDALLIVNDDWPLAAALGIGAVHLGEDDGDIAEARRALGPEALIGVSCYASVARAQVADYLAFGALFASGTKPLARRASLDLFGQVRALQLGLPLVGIGGIDAGNIGTVLAAGADAAAVIGSLFGQGDVGAAARALVAAAGRPPGRGGALQARSRHASADALRHVTRRRRPDSPGDGR